MSDEVSYIPTDISLITDETTSTLFHYLFYGQSLSIGAYALSAVSNYHENDNLTFENGPYSTVSGTDFNSLVLLKETHPTETPCTGSCAYISSHSDRRMFSTTAGRDGFQISVLVKGSNWYNDVVWNHLNSAPRVINAAGYEYVLDAVGWIQGFHDQCVVETPVDTYKSKMLGLREDIEADYQSITGNTNTVYMFSYQSSVGPSTGRRTVCKAVYEAALEDENFFLVTAAYPFELKDYVHLTAYGYRLMAMYFGRAYHKKIVEMEDWVPLKPNTIESNGSVISVSFDVPSPPITIDTDIISEVNDYGFVVEDDSGVRDILDISLTGVDSLEITIDGSIDTNPSLRYAMDYIASDSGLGGGWGGGQGNLRDSDPDVWGSPRGDMPMYNWLVHFDLDF